MYRRRYNFYEEITKLGSDHPYNSSIINKGNEIFQIIKKYNISFSLIQAMNCHSLIQIIHSKQFELFYMFNSPGKYPDLLSTPFAIPNTFYEIYMNYNVEDLKNLLKKEEESLEILDGISESDFKTIKRKIEEYKILLSKSKNSTFYEKVRNEIDSVFHHKEEKCSKFKKILYKKLQVNLYINKFNTGLTEVKNTLGKEISYYKSNFPFKNNQPIKPNEKTNKEISNAFIVDKIDELKEDIFSKENFLLPDYDVEFMNLIDLNYVDDLLLNNEEEENEEAEDSI